MENPTAYELMTRIEEIFALCDERQVIIETLDNVYGIWLGQDNQGKFVWYNANEQVITKEEVK